MLRLLVRDVQDPLAVFDVIEERVIHGGGFRHPRYHMFGQRAKRVVFVWGFRGWYYYTY
jgi:hypothetical protein